MAFPGHLPGNVSNTPYGMKQPGIYSHQQQSSPLDAPSNEQLALFLISKPLNARSWTDTTPVRQRVSSSEIQRALDKLNKDPKKNVKDMLISLKSDSARMVIDALVQDENNKLMQYDPTSEWIIAGISIQKETVKYLMARTEVIKSISVILKTEPSSFNRQDFDDEPPIPPPPFGIFENERAHLNHNNRHEQHNGNARMHLEPVVLPPVNQPQFHVPEQGHIREQFPPPQFSGHNGLANHGGRPGQNDQGDHHIIQQHPPGLGQIQNQGNGPQGMVMPPPPPPPPQQMPPPPIVNPPFEPPQLSRPVPGAYPEQHIQPNVPGHFPAPVVMDPHMLKHQKSKSKSLRRDYQERREHDLEIDSETSDSSSQYSLKSAENGAYGYIERSRSRGRQGRQTRSRSRSSDRIRFPKAHKTKKVHGRARSDIEAIHHDKHKPSSKDSSPRSSAAALPAQPIINIRIDNDNDRERDRLGDRVREVYTPDHDTRRNIHNMTSPTFSQPIYNKHEKFDVHKMSRHSSLGGSESGSSIIDGSSSIYTSDDSVFSEPVRPRTRARVSADLGGGVNLRSRNIPVPYDDGFGTSYHDSRRRQKERLPADEYPPTHRPRGSLHEDHIEPHRAPSYRRPSLASRRHSGQTSPTFDPRYPAQPSRSYTDVPPSYAFKAQPPPQRYVAEERPDAFELRAMADQLDAMNYINQSRRTGMPPWRNSIRGRMGAAVDEWAYRPQERMYDGYRHV